MVQKASKFVCRIEQCVVRTRVVLRRVEAGSYLISNKKGEEQAVHEDQIKPHVEDVFAGPPRELYFWRGGQYENRVNT